MSGPAASLSVAIRADASAAIGTGHIRRCLAIAESLAARGHEVSFLVNEEAADVVPGLADSGYALVFVRDEQETAEQMAALPGAPLDLVLFDHYTLDARIHRLYRRAFHKIAVIDDLADRELDADLLFDINFGREASDYDGLVPRHCRLCIGHDYQIVRRSFAPYRAQAVPRRYRAGERLRILVCVGGADPRGLTLKITQQLVASGVEPELDIIAGANNRDIGPITKLAAQLGAAAEVHGAVDDIEARMARANFAIGAAGTMTWERNFMALPSILLVLADNQTLVGKAMEDAGAAIVFDVREGLGERAIAESVAGLTGDGERLQAMSDIANSIASRDGVGEIARAMECVALEKNSAHLVN